MRKLLVLASLFALVGLGTVAAAQGAKVPTTTVDLTGVVLVNTCSAENVTFTGGTETIKAHVTDAGSGRVNFGEEVSFRGDGVGSVTGANYRLNENANATENNVLVPDNGAIVIQVEENLTFVGQGNVPNLKIHVNSHQTTTPDGTVTAVVNTFTTTCQ